MLEKNIVFTRKKALAMVLLIAAALVLLMAGFVIGLPLLVAAYRRIYEKYKV